MANLFNLELGQSCQTLFHQAQLRFDGHAMGYLSLDKLSTRNLQAITCQTLLAQKSMLQLILEKVDTDFTDWPSSVKKVACLFQSGASQGVKEIVLL